MKAALVGNEEMKMQQRTAIDHLSKRQTVGLFLEQKQQRCFDHIQKDRMCLNRSECVGLCDVWSCQGFPNSLFLSRKKEALRTKVTQVMHVSVWFKL